jgi:hypothetical protein
MKEIILRNMNTDRRLIRIPEAGDNLGDLVAKTSNYTMAETDVFVSVDATGGAVTITLPPAADVGAGKHIGIKKVDASANAVTVDGDGSETIDGAATVSLAAQWASLFAVSNGTNWLIY